MKIIKSDKVVSFLRLPLTDNSYDYRLIYERKTSLITQMYERA